MEQDMVKILNELDEAGIQFVVSLVDGYFNLTPGEVLQYLKEPDLIAAQAHGVSLDLWMAWKNFIFNPRCYAITRRGKPCQITPRSVRLKEFIPGVSEYCSVHQKYTY